MKYREAWEWPLLQTSRLFLEDDGGEFFMVKHLYPGCNEQFAYWPGIARQIKFCPYCGLSVNLVTQEIGNRSYRKSLCTRNIRRKDELVEYVACVFRFKLERWCDIDNEWYTPFTGLNPDSTKDHHEAARLIGFNLNELRSKRKTNMMRFYIEPSTPLNLP